MPPKKAAAKKKKAPSKHRGCTVKRTVKGKGGKMVTRRVPSAAKALSGQCPLPKGYKLHKTKSGKHTVVKVKSAKKKTAHKKKAAAPKKKKTHAKKKAAAGPKAAATAVKAAAKAIETVARAASPKHIKKGGARAAPLDQYAEPPMYADDYGRMGGYYDEALMDPRMAGGAYGGYDDFEQTAARYAGAGYGGYGAAAAGYAGYGAYAPVDPRMAGGAAYDPYYGAAPAYAQEPMAPRYAGAGYADAYGYDAYGPRYAGAADVDMDVDFGGYDEFGAADVGGAMTHRVKGYYRRDGSKVKPHRALYPATKKKAAPKRKAAAHRRR